MDKEYLAKLCDARDTVCGFCEADECEKCIVSHLIDDAYNKMPDDDGSFTAFAYEDDGVTTAEMATYDTAEEAIEFAKSHSWDEVVNDISCEVVYRR